MEVKEPAASYAKRRYTIEEYLEMENISSEKHEYYKGEIFAMAGASHNHNRIIRNIYFALGKLLEGGPCEPWGSDTRIHVEKNTLFTYPDLSIICDKPEFFKEDNVSITNPTVIIEVLSPSTRNYDKGDKFGLYRAIPSLKQYILIESESVGVESFSISAQGIWQLHEWLKLDDSLSINNINVSIPLKTIYDQVEWDISK